MPESELPPKIAEGALLEGNEYGWEPSLFPAALANAQALGYACIGGQFQFRLDIGTCEMYWLSADSGPRDEAESWLEYCERSCSEVRAGFQKLMSETDFRKQALEWHPVREAMAHAASSALWTTDESLRSLGQQGWVRAARKAGLHRVFSR